MFQIVPSRALSGVYSLISGEALGGRQGARHGCWALPVKLAPSGAGKGASEARGV